MRAVLILALPLLAYGAEQTFEVRGHIKPPRRAMASLHATADSFATTTQIGNDGAFRFKRVRAGSYSLSISVLNSGEIRSTIDVGPATADRNGRVYIEVDRYSAHVAPDRFATVTKTELSVPSEARREYAAAEKRLARRDEEGAKRHYMRAVEIAPQFAAAWNNLGTITYKAKDFSAAEAYFRRALEADPDSYEPRVNLGGVLITLDKLAEAREVNTSAIARRPKDPLAHSQLGLIYLRMNWLVPAETHLKIASELDPSHFSTPQLSLAEVYLRRKSKRKAAEQLEELLRHHPNWPDQAKVRETIKLWSSSAN